jgi:hypothetical protein
MALFAAGNFVAADGTALSVADPNFAVAAGGAATIQSNRVMPSSSGVVARHSGVPVSANYAVEGDFYRATSGAGNVGIVGRMPPTGATGYYARYETTTGSYQLFRMVGGGFTQISGNVPATFNVGETKNIRLEMAGTTISMYAGGAVTPTIQGTDSAITAKGQAGIRCGSLAPNIHLASFIAYDPFSAFLAAGQNQVIQNA